MPNLKMRPRFAVDLRCEAASVVEVLERGIEQAEPPLEGSFAPNHCVLRIPDARRSFWSPELDVTFERIAESGEGGAPALRVRCLFGPRPAVWTGFAFLYSFLAAIGVVSALFGTAQLTLGNAPSGFLVTAGAFGLLGLIYAANYIGRGLAAFQMYEIRRYLDDALEEIERQRGPTPRTALDSARL